MKDRVIILHNIRSVLNTGAIFRTAEAIGVDQIYLTGYTPTPIDRFGRKRGDFKKSALGAEDILIWKQEDIFDLIKKLKQEKYQIIALEQSDKSIDYKKIKDADRMAIILGNETDGISKDILNLCDQIAEIPMRGKKESLNVSVATGIFLYKLFDK